jgi:uncharacterized tellurite resistance protein B-like protein
MKLNNREKFAFLQLAYYIAHIDGEFQAQEENIIEEYCAEMGIEKTYFNLNEFNMEETLSEIHTDYSKKIVILELMVLIHSDDRFHELEEKVLTIIIDVFKISQEQLALYSQWGKMVSALYTQGTLFIGEDDSI